MNEVDEVFKYKSKLSKIGIYFLIVGVVGLPIGILLSDSAPSISGAGIGLGIGGLFGAVMLYSLYFIYYFVFQSRIKKYDMKYGINNIKAELAEPDALKSISAYFTKNYIVSPNNGNLFICRYEELKWIYKDVAQQNGITVARRIVGYVAGDKKLQFIIANSDDNTIMQIFQLIHSRNPYVLIGFTKENKEAYKSQL